MSYSGKREGERKVVYDSLGEEGGDPERLDSESEDTSEWVSSERADGRTNRSVLGRDLQFLNITPTPTTYSEGGCKVLGPELMSGSVNTHNPPSPDSDRYAKG